MDLKSPLSCPNEVKSGENQVRIRSEGGEGFGSGWVWRVVPGRSGWEVMLGVSTRRVKHGPVILLQDSCGLSESSSVSAARAPCSKKEEG